MLKDLVDYFKLEEINIDNWTFKLYYKVICLQIEPVWRVLKKNGDTFLFWRCPKLANLSISLLSMNIAMILHCVRSVFQYLSNVSRVSCQKNNVLERITVDPRATVSWINNNLYCSQLNFAQPNKRWQIWQKIFQVSVVICMAGATIGIASQYFGDPIRW